MCQISAGEIESKLNYYSFVTAKQLKTAVKQLLKYWNSRIKSNKFDVCAEFHVDRLSLSWLL